MLRWLVVCILLSVAAMTSVYFLVGPKRAVADSNTSVQEGASSPGKPAPRSSRGRGPQGLGDLTEYAHTPTETGRAETVVVPNCRIVIGQQQEVPSEEQGKLIFIGTEIKDGEEVPEDKRLEARFGYLAIQVLEGDKTPKNQWFRFDSDPSGKAYRRWKEGDPIEPNRIKVGVEMRPIRKLEVGDQVVRGQLLGLTNPDLDFDNLSTKVSHLNAAEAERIAARSAKEEARRRVDSMRPTLTTPGATSVDDYQAARLAYVTKMQEEVAKENKVLEAQREVNAALTKLKMHEIRAAIPGIVRVIYKNSEGDAVKPLESVLQLQNPDRLQVQGQIEVQEAEKLRRGMEVTVEASRPVPPTPPVMSGHLEAVTCVAVSATAANSAAKSPPLILSGSEDHTLCGWDSSNGRLLFRMSTGSAVPRALACTAPQSPRRLALVGCSDGSAYLIDLDRRKDKPRLLADRHTSAINCVAFSPKGDLCVTGGDDTRMRLWNTAGELLHTVTAHQNAVTSLEFAGPTQVVSAGRDGRIIVWKLESGKAPARVSTLDGRSGDVAQLGVSPDGKQVLFDQGKEIRILSLAGQRIEGTIQNTSATSNFTTLALFAPDGKTILTSGGGSGLLQLWRRPEGGGRASELRQLIWNTAPATCAAFAPDGSFAVTGTQDHQVLLWRNLPGKEESDKPLKARLVLVEKHLDTSSRQVRVWAELDNPGWLVPGGSATLVIPAGTAEQGALKPEDGR